LFTGLIERCRRQKRRQKGEVADEEDVELEGSRWTYLGGGWRGQEVEGGADVEESTLEVEG
jgi:hypothetical protein